ncbi:MAG TPA: DMT family transporter [Rectinemataceae bacterium]|nr:DMT family transporter [Rectinemataceae bacterium]
MQTQKRMLPVAAVLVAAGLGASSGLYIKGIGLSSLALAGFRMGVPFFAVLPYLARRGRMLGEKSERKGLWLASGINAVRMLLFVMAYKLTTIGNAVVLLYLWPIFALVFDCVRFRRWPERAQLGLLALAFGGVVTMNYHRGFSLSSEDFLGSALMILSACLFAATVIMFKKALAKVHETDALFFQNAIGAIVYAPFLFAELGGASLHDIGLGLSYGLAVGLVGFGLFFFGMKRLPLFQYSALAYSEVPFGLALGVLVLGEDISGTQLAGAAMILGASFVAQRLRTRA